MAKTNCGFDEQYPENGRDALVLHGPTLHVRIGFDQNYRPAPGLPPDLPVTSYPALVDTGASECCIDSSLAAVLDLPIVDRQVLSGISGTESVNLHLAQIYISSLNFTVYGRFAGVHLSAGGQPHSALIGRTFLQLFAMMYDGRTGRVILTTD